MAASEGEVGTDVESSKALTREQEKQDNIYVEYLLKILDEIKNSVVKSVMFYHSVCLFTSSSYHDSYDELPETLQEDIRKSAEEIMKQLQPQLNDNLQVRKDIRVVSLSAGWLPQVQFDQMLQEFNTVERLQELVRLKAQYHNHGPAWLVLG